MPARLMKKVSMHIAGRNGSVLCCVDVSVERFRERAICLGSSCVKTPSSSSRARLFLVTLLDHMC